MTDSWVFPLGSFHPFDGILSALGVVGELEGSDRGADDADINKPDDDVHGTDAAHVKNLDSQATESPTRTRSAIRKSTRGALRKKSNGFQVATRPALRAPSDESSNAICTGSFLNSFHTAYPLIHVLGGTAACASWALNLSSLMFALNQKMLLANPIILNPIITSASLFSTFLAVKGMLALVVHEHDKDRRLGENDYFALFYAILGFLPVSWWHFVSHSRICLAWSNAVAAPFQLTFPGILGLAALFEIWHIGIADVTVKPMGQVGDESASSKSGSVESNVGNEAEEQNVDTSEDQSSPGKTGKYDAEVKGSETEDKAASPSDSLQAQLYSQAAGWVSDSSADVRDQVATLAATLFCFVRTGGDVSATRAAIERMTAVNEKLRKSRRGGAVTVNNEFHDADEKVDENAETSNNIQIASPYNSSQCGGVEAGSVSSSILCDSSTDEAIRSFEEVSRDLSDDLSDLDDAVTDGREPASEEEPRARATDKRKQLQETQPHTDSDPNPNDTDTDNTDTKLSPLVLDDTMPLGESLEHAQRYVMKYMTECPGAVAFFTMQCVDLIFDVGVDYTMTRWRGNFFDTFQRKDFPMFKSLLSNFLVIAGSSVVIGAYSDYMVGLWDLTCRQYYVRYFIENSWFNNGALYKMNLENRGLRNCDQRVHEDIGAFIGGTRKLSFGFVDALVRLCIFFPQLVMYAPPGIWELVLAMSIGSSIATHLLGKNILGANIAIQNAEASFRHGLIQAVEQAESMALNGGDQGLIRHRFEEIKSALWNSMQIGFNMQRYTSLYGLTAGILPFVILAPTYFSGGITLGAMFQIESIIGHVQGSLDFFVGSYGEVQGWRVTTNRLIQMEQYNRQIAEAYGEGGGKVKALGCNTNGMLAIGDGESGSGSNFGADANDASKESEPNSKNSHKKDTLKSRMKSAMHRSIELRAPAIYVGNSAEAVLEDVDLLLRPGDRILITGPCGSGKSILLRTLAGAWPERWVHPSTTLVRPDSAFAHDESDTGKTEKVSTTQRPACYNLQSSALIHQSNMFFGREKTGPPEPDSSTPPASKANALVKFVSQTPFISGLEHLTLRQILLHDVLPAAEVAQLYANPELLKILERTAAYRLSKMAEKKGTDAKSKAGKHSISHVNDNNPNNLTKSTTDESSASAAYPPSLDPSSSDPPSSGPDSQPAVGLLGFPKLSQEFVYTEEAYQRDLHIARMLADDEIGLDGTISTEFEESHEIMSFEEIHDVSSGEPSKSATKPNRFAMNNEDHDAEPGNLTRTRTDKAKRKPPVQLGSSVALPGDSAEVAARKMVLAREATHFQAEFFYDVVCRRALRDAGLGGGRVNVKSVTDENNGNANNDSQQQQTLERKAETSASSFQDLEPLLDTTLSRLHFSASELTQLMFAQLFVLLQAGRGKYLVLDDIASCAPAGGEGERLIELLVRKLRPHQAVLVFKQAANGGPADEVDNVTLNSSTINTEIQKLQSLQPLHDSNAKARAQFFTDEFTIREKRLVRVAKE